jgi:hypothetical protein
MIQTDKFKKREGRGFLNRLLKYRSEGKGYVHSITGHKDPEGE